MWGTILPQGLHARKKINEELARVVVQYLTVFCSSMVMYNGREERTMSSPGVRVCACMYHANIQGKQIDSNFNGSCVVNFSGIGLVSMLMSSCSILFGFFVIDCVSDLCVATGRRLCGGGGTHTAPAALRED